VFSRESIQRELALCPSPIDIKRREYLAKLHQATGRNIILYAMKPPLGAIWVDDLQGFMAAQHELKGDQLDLIVHSTGGSSEAAEQIVSYLRQKYKHIRVIVPLYAMSAATMIACAADEILMGRQSALGPIDPQL
jgi:ATP-dependent protease ClpP protease subunit